jgi:hypothetical protein
MWDLWWAKWYWDRFFSEFFSFPLSYCSTVALHIHISGGWIKYPFMAAVQRHSLTPSTWTTTISIMMVQWINHTTHFSRQWPILVEMRQREATPHFTFIPDTSFMFSPSYVGVNWENQCQLDNYMPSDETWRCNPEPITSIYDVTIAITIS